MLTPQKLIVTVFILILLSITVPVQASTTPWQEPDGFKLLDQAPGVKLYRKNYSNGVPDYVQVLDLSAGAQLVPLHGGIAEARPRKGVYDGADPSFYSKSLQKYWNDLTSLHPNAFCVSNGQFFYMKEYPTRLPFPLRVDNKVISDGYDLRGFPEQKLLLLIWPGKADIVPLEKDTLYHTSAVHAIGGLTEEARKSPTKYVGRTFVGVDDRNGDGLSELVLIYSTSSARQKDAAAVLRSFGADRVMMFDGGGSTQLHCKGKDYIASERLLPQALGIVAAPKFEAPLMKRASDAQAQPIDAESPENEQLIAQTGEQIADNPGRGEEAQLDALYTGPDSVKLEDVIWVPVSILPLALIVLLVVDRVRRTAD